MSEASAAQIRLMAQVLTGWADAGTQVDADAIGELIQAATKLQFQGDASSATASLDQSDPVMEEATPNRSG